MIGTIRKHQKWLWLVIITLTIISFVIFFSPYQKVSSAFGRPTASLGTINGEPVNAESYRDALAEVFLRYFLTHGDWPDKDPAAKQTGFDEQRETYYRLLLLQKQKELNVHASGTAVAQLGADILRSYQKAGVDSLDSFEKRILLARGFTATDFERFLHHEIGMQQLIAATGTSGKLVTLPEADFLYRHDHEEVAAEAVFFPATNYLASVPVNAEAVTQFFTNRIPNYRLPERMQVSYVKFELTNFWAEADEKMAGLTNFAALVQLGMIPQGDQSMAMRLTNLTALIDVIYEQRGTNYYRDAKSPEEAKETIKNDIHRDLALVSARKKAAEFASALLDQDPVRAENLDKLAAEKKLTVKVSAPFDKEDGPQDLTVRTDFTRRAFALTAEEPVAGPIAAEDGVYIIALKKKIPSEIPPLDSIRDKVTTDYNFSQALQLARQAGTNFYTTLTNGMAQGKTFASLCREAKLSPILLPPFSRSTRSLPEVEDRVPLGLLQEVAFRVPPGKASYFFSTADGGFIVQVQSRLPLDEGKLKTELPGFLSYLRQARQNEAFNDWFRKQAEAGLRDTPLARAQQAQSSAPTKK